MDYTIGFYTDSDFRLIASSWLKQQDLAGKSPVEVSAMYYNAISEIREHYQQQIQDAQVRQATRLI